MFSPLLVLLLPVLGQALVLVQLQVLGRLQLEWLGLVRLQLELELAQLEGQLEAELAQLVGQGLRVQVERCSRVDETVMVVTLVDE